MMCVFVDIKKYTKDYNSALPNSKSAPIDSKKVIANRQQFCQVSTLCSIIITTM